MFKNNDCTEYNNFNKINDMMIMPVHNRLIGFHT